MVWPVPPWPILRAVVRPDSDVMVLLAPALALPLNVDQSAADSAPRFAAEAVGMLRVITGVVVPVATEELTSVPVVFRVSAATLETEPVPLLLNVVQSVLAK